MALDPIGYLLVPGKPPLLLVKGDVVTLGRDSQNKIPVEDAAASRNHACIDCQEGAVLVRDLGSRNGTFVNGARLAADELLALSSGDEIRIGGRVFYFVSATTGVEPRKVALERSRQLSQMRTIGWDSPYYAEEGKVVTKGEPTSPALSPVPSQAQETRKAINEVPPSAVLSGSLSPGALPQILQFIHAGGMSGRLRVKGQRLDGAIFFLNGLLYAAAAPGVRGPAAVYACAQEREGRFSFDRLEGSEVRQTARNITENTIQVIFECCRSIDEAAGNRAAPPPAAPQ